MKEIIDNINKGMDKILSFFIFFSFTLLAGLGFAFGGFALLIIFIEKGLNPYIIELSFRMVGVLLSILVVIVVLKFYFWLIQKYLMPRVEKKSKERDEERKKELIKIICNSVRKELKGKRKK